MDCQMIHAGIRKCGGMRKLLKQWKSRKSVEIGKKEKSTEAWEEHKKSKQNTIKVISLAKGKKHREFASDLNDPNQQNEIFE